MSKSATDGQVELMMNNWLLNSSRFCINLDWPNGNSDTCYWGLPSISADDPAFPPLGYWRGYVWAPWAQLTYWALQEYEHLPLVSKTRKALAKQMTAMMLDV